MTSLATSLRSSLQPQAGGANGSVTLNLRSGAYKEGGVGASLTHNPAGQRSKIFIERLWRSLKQEALYLEEISDGFQARRVIKKWITFYNTERPHSALDRQTPDDAYWAGLEQQKVA